MAKKIFKDCLEYHLQENDNWRGDRQVAVTLKTKK